MARNYSSDQDYRGRAQRDRNEQEGDSYRREDYRGHPARLERGDSYAGPGRYRGESESFDEPYRSGGYPAARSSSSSRREYENYGSGETTGGHYSSDSRAYRYADESGRPARDYRSGQGYSGSYSESRQDPESWEQHPMRREYPGAGPRRYQENYEDYENGRVGRYEGGRNESIRRGNGYNEDYSSNPGRRNAYGQSQGNYGNEYSPRGENYSTESYRTGTGRSGQYGQGAQQYEQNSGEWSSRSNESGLSHSNSNWQDESRSNYGQSRPRNAGYPTQRSAPHQDEAGEMQNDYRSSENPNATGEEDMETADTASGISSRKSKNSGLGSGTSSRGKSSSRSTLSSAGTGSSTQTRRSNASASSRNAVSSSQSKGKSGGLRSGKSSSGGNGSGASAESES